MPSSICNSTNFVCTGGRTVNTEVAAAGQTDIQHTKNRRVLLNVGGVDIVMQSLVRSFHINYFEESQWTGYAVFDGSDPNPYFCGTKTGDGGATISENINMLSTEIYFLDHINKIMFWKEVIETCTFAYTAEKIAVFRAAFGSFYSHWFEVYPQKTITTTYKLLINGSVEDVETIVEAVTDPLINILFPLPPSDVGPTGDPDDAPATFYDYFIDEQLKELDGGIDWYYPSWMRSMGIDRAEDVADALDRYVSYYGQGNAITLPEVEILQMPSLPETKPNGNAVVDSAGNILLSFTGKEITINRLYKKINGAYTMLNLNTLDNPIMSGDNLKLYPVGIVD